MSIDRNVSVSPQISWAVVQTEDITRRNYIGSVGNILPLSSGDINAVYHISGTMPAGGTLVIDMAALEFDLFGQTVEFALTTLNAAAIENLGQSGQADSGNLKFCTTGTNMFIGLHDQAVSGKNISPGMSLVDASPSGWAIGSDSKFILKDSGLGVQFAIALVGSSG